MNVEISPPVQARLYGLPPILVAELDGAPVQLRRAEPIPADGFDILLNGVPYFHLKEWHYHVLNSVFGSGADTLDGIAGIVADRFGIRPGADEIRALFLDLNDHGLLNPDEARGLAVVAGALAQTKVVAEDPETARKAQAGTAVQPASSRKGIPLFRPAPLLRLLQPLFRLAVIAAIALPALVVVAAFTTVRDWTEIVSGFTAVHRDFDLFTFLVFGLLTVNLASAAAHAAAVHAMGGTVEAVALRFYFGVIPRLTLWLDDTEKLSRRQAIWTHAAPLLTRLFLASAGIVVWDATRYLGGSLNQMILAVAVTAFVSFLIAACPLLKGSGYLVLAEFLDEPNLRAKAMRALLNVFNRNHYQVVDERILVAYALASLLFAALLLVGVLLVLQERLVSGFDATGYTVVAGIVALLVWRVVSQLRTTNELYWKSYRFERWRERTLPSQAQKQINEKHAFGIWKVTRIMALAALVLLLFQPYPYRPSGQVTLLPNAMRELSTDIEGIVAEVHFEGGEYLTAGTLIAKLDTRDLEAEMRVLQARLQEATVNDDFAADECDRNAPLAKSGSISDAAFQKTLSRCSETAAALETAKAEIQRVGLRIERSSFRMPFDGTLGTLYLQERLGTYLDEGEAIASVRDTSSYKVRLRIREVDVPLVKVGDPVEVRVYAYPSQIFLGEVRSIDPDVELKTGATVTEMVATIENRDDMLQSGMTGYAKVAGEERQIWEILTQTIHRFIAIDLWAWLP